MRLVQGYALVEPNRKATMGKNPNHGGAPLCVLHLINGLATGGAERMLSKLVVRSDHTRFRHVVVSMMDEGTLGPHLRAAGIPVFQLGMRQGRPSPRAALEFSRILGRERPAVVQTWMYHADFLGLVAGKLRRVPRIVWNLRCSASPVTLRTPLTRGLVRVLARLSALPDVVIANAEAGRRTHEALGYAPKRWEIIPNGFDLEEFAPDPEAARRTRGALGIARDALVIGMVANFTPPKDHDTFLAAAQRIAHRHEDVQFVLVGRGVDRTDDHLRAMIASTEIEGRVHLLGERSDVPEIVPAFDLAISSSCEEGFPNTIGEAMACGVPCLVTDVGDSARIVGPTGRTVPARDPDALASAAHEMLALGRSELNRLGQAARTRIREEFGLSAVVARYENLYLELASLP